MQWRIELSQSARKFLKRVPKKDGQRIRAALLAMTYNPYTGDVWKMRGVKETWRYRIGAYRIFFELNETACTVLVYGIERRTSSTY